MQKQGISLLVWPSWGTALNTTQLNFNYASQVRVTATASRRWIYASPMWPLLRSSLRLVWRRPTNFILWARAFIPRLLHTQTPSTDGRPLHCRTHRWHTTAASKTVPQSSGIQPSLFAYPRCNFSSTLYPHKVVIIQVIYRVHNLYLK
jgi:hypothetical protein